MKAVVAAFNQEKALVGAFSVITNLWMEFFEALVVTDDVVSGLEGGAWEAVRGGEPGGDVQDEDLDGQQDQDRETQQTFPRGKSVNGLFYSLSKLLICRVRAPSRWR